jgi:heme a synthase
MNPRQRLFWFRRLALVGAALAAVVVVLGAWVRLTNAGLGCPDWPGCYGHLYPQPGLEVGKAWHEMIHRYVAGSLLLVITTLLVWAVWRRKDRDQPLVPVALLFLIVCLQAALGALTVTRLLKPLIVTAHLFGGLTTLSLLLWLSITPRHDPSPSELGLRKFALVGFAILVLQIFLGGWTSTNYAAVACPDFPTCQRSWWPPMDFRDAFVLWRGMDIDYEGGVLANGARTAIHVTHRLGAVLTGSVLLILGLTTLVRGRGNLSRAGLLVSVAVLLQITLGIATVHFGMPLPLATLHNAGAALLVASMTWLLRALWPVPPRPAAAPGMVPLRRVNRPE